MKAVGIVAEYNPLHNGHIYHMNRARDLSGADAVVVAMSGSFVQRGMPAVFDKWMRSEHALRSGADLVVEIPVLSCLGNAGQYAGCGVRLLESLGCTHIAFGSESGKTDELRAASDFIRENSEKMREAIRSAASGGLSYPKARQRAYEMLGGPDAGLLPETPNDILAYEYISAMRTAEPLAVLRKGAGYHEGQSESEYQSASALREMLGKGMDISAYVPECTAEAGTETGTMLSEGSEERLFDMVRYAVMSRSSEWIDDCQSGGEGLGNLLRSSCAGAKSLDDLIMSVKSRRYTYTRISRLCMQVLLGITREKYCPGDHETAAAEPGYIRVLGFNDRGRELLSETRKGGLASLPVITNINKEGDLPDEAGIRSLELDVFASDIYSLLTGRDIGSFSDHRRRPVMI